MGALVLTDYPARSAARVDVPLSCAKRWGEATPYQRLEYSVTSVGHHRGVTLQGGLGLSYWNKNK